MAPIPGGGVGGVDRGPGHVRLDYGNETSGDTERFDVKLLPRAKRLDPEQTAVLSVGTTAPEAQPVPESAGAVEVDATTGRSVWRRRLAPGHRRVVREFFGTEGQR